MGERKNESERKRACARGRERAGAREGRRKGERERNKKRERERGKIMRAREKGRESLRERDRTRARARVSEPEGGERGGSIKFLVLDLVTREIMWCEAVGCSEVKES